MYIILHQAHPKFVSCYKPLRKIFDMSHKIKQMRSGSVSLSFKTRLRETCAV